MGSAWQVALRGTDVWVSCPSLPSTRTSRCAAASRIRWAGSESGQRDATVSLKHSCMPFCVRKLKERLGFKLSQHRVHQSADSRLISWQLPKVVMYSAEQMLVVTNRRIQITPSGGRIATLSHLSTPGSLTVLHGKLPLDRFSRSQPRLQNVLSSLVTLTGS